MPNNEPTLAGANRVLIKLRPSSALGIAESRANLRPLHETPAATSAFGIESTAQWFVAELPDGGATPWDVAHARVADQLSLTAADILFVEPDLIHRVFAEDLPIAGEAFAVGELCVIDPQDGTHNKAIGPNSFAWHLHNDFTQLDQARQAVNFAGQRTRIAHIDTGYYPAHETVPEHVLRQFERNFVIGDANPTSAADPDNRVFPLDNSGHGTATLSILAGGKVSSAQGIYLGGAYAAEVLPLRIADSVALISTSTFAQALRYAVSKQCDVASLSMGGLPSSTWNEAVNEAYLAGLCLVAASGDNIAGFPTRHTLYPARYRRVVAVCGVMADGRPYANLSGGAIEGNYGPSSRMTTAISAYTPNIPWARFGCQNIVSLNGVGTSAATPQVAAAVALWFEKYKHELPRDWRRVEAVRYALFSSVKNKHADFEHLGEGILQADTALSVKPFLSRPQTPAEDDSFSFLRVITGLGITETPVRERMFNLELMQRWLINPDLQAIVPDPENTAQLDRPTLEKVMEAIIEDPGASVALRKHIVNRYPIALGKYALPSKQTQDVVAPLLAACDTPPMLQDPPYRRLRVYATDPSLSARFETAAINEVTLKVRWEQLDPGPIGKYLEIVDTDAAGQTYAPVNLNDSRLLAQDGWAPSEGNAQFHQQMTYAVAMKTIEYFELALGRPIFWQAQPDSNGKRKFVPQLKVVPHALHEANSYYSPVQSALLFGYFEAAADDPSDHVPGSRIYSCLSHDIIAHETTHAILDGMYRLFNTPTNPDVLAFHEAFADIVALMQHFTISQLLENEIVRAHGNLEAETILGSLAIQFGRAMGGRAALRDAIGWIENGTWHRFVPDPTDLQRRLTPHTRGAVLVAAVFDAFIIIYKARTGDLLRIATNGTNDFPSGAFQTDLVRRLADEASKTAIHVLTMCIRALDYLPPVDITFFDYLRALITADLDLIDDDRFNYRIAFVEAFRRRGIYPHDMTRTFSVDTLRWQGFDQTWLIKGGNRAIIKKQFVGVIALLKQYAKACSYIKDRHKIFTTTEQYRKALSKQLTTAFANVPDFATELGLDPRQPFEVLELRRAIRINPDGYYISQVIVAVAQVINIDGGEDGKTDFLGGSTLVIDLVTAKVIYRIVKNINSQHRKDLTAAFVHEVAADPLRKLLLGLNHAEPFAALHAFDDDGV